MLACSPVAAVVLVYLPAAAAALDLPAAVAALYLPVAAADTLQCPADMPD